MDAVDAAAHVRMIRHPPSAVPAVSAAAHATITQVGADSESIRPSASSSAAITPTDFCASLAPWLKASAADVTHCPARTGRASAGSARARPAGGRGSRAERQPAEHRRDRERDQGPEDADRMQPSMPPQLTASMPPSTTAAPTSPPTRAWPELDGSPSRQVTRFQVTAAARPEPITSIATDGRDGDDAADRVGDRRAEEQRAQQVEDRGQDDRLRGPRGPRSDQRRDRVGGVVQAVRDREGEREERPRPRAPRPSADSMPWR